MREVIREADPRFIRGGSGGPRRATDVAEGMTAGSAYTRHSSSSAETLFAPSSRA